MKHLLRRYNGMDALEKAFVDACIALAVALLVLVVGVLVAQL